MAASISSSNLIDAKLEEHQLCGSKQCPGCGHKLEGKPDWLGLPAGVKFDPTDQELIEHLEAKVEAKDMRSHPLIDEFIPTIEGEDGICYTHPEKLPGQNFQNKYHLSLSPLFKVVRNAPIGEGSNDPISRRDSGSGSCSSKEIIPQRDEISGTGPLAVSISSCTALDIHQLKSDHFGFTPFRKSFDEVGIREASVAREASASGTCDEIQEHHQRPHHVAHDPHQQQQQQQLHHHHTAHHQIATAAFHISRPSHPISTIIPPPPLHHTSIILDEDPYHVSRLMLQNEIQQQQHKLGGRSASGLEEFIMGCTSTDVKEESSITNPQEADWLKYSSFWPDPDNQDPHG
ncbi:hypothetical protein OIU77_030518 [Salix suchowensis]|uniref:NAC domain-containing protein n=1 Tax=Salix suchowensis TaxID=1278906 RepID=A0ABQ9BCK5_9ROSI|nr:hypothetical protein OIU77_030518 [Salix suchowensis]